MWFLVSHIWWFNTTEMSYKLFLTEQIDKNLTMVATEAIAYF